jgi:hypothetical protein
MAWDMDRTSIKISRVAKVDLRTKQFCFVKLAAAAAAYSDGLEDQVDLCAAATDIPIGVLQNKPNAGEEAEIMMAGITKIQGNADLSAGFPGTPVLIATSNDGQAAAALSTNYVVGQLLQAPTGAGIIGVMAVNCLAPALKA